MKLRQVTDLALTDIERTRYDIGVFASGYEERCTYLSQRFQELDVLRPIVLGFETLTSAPTRIASDQYFEGRWGVKPIRASADDEATLYESLHESCPQTRSTLRLLVDYSSMSRLWYAGILNWSRYATSYDQIIVDFVYSAGRYQSSQGTAVIRDIISIPGCEGEPTALASSVAVFGLGFDALAALCVFDRLEPDITFAFLADPGSNVEYPLLVSDINRELSELHAKSLLRLPLASVEQTYRYLAEIVQFYRRSADITFVPMGPKPHVLACILLAHTFREVACLRVSKEEQPTQIVPTGEVVASRVELKTEEASITTPHLSEETELLQV